MQYNRARWYDPATGRWLSTDPIGFGGGDVNLYRMVGNHPTSATDPSGLEEPVQVIPWNGKPPVVIPWDGKPIVESKIYHPPQETSDQPLVSDEDRARWEAERRKVFKKVFGRYPKDFYDATLENTYQENVQLMAQGALAYGTIIVGDFANPSIGSLRGLKSIRIPRVFGHTPDCFP